MRTLLLVRHPAVCDTWRGRCYGVSDVPLSEAGRRRAVDLAHEIAARPEPLALVCHSALGRCRFVAEVLRGLHTAPTLEDPRLNERDFGAWEGMPWDDIYAQTGDAMMGMVDAPDSFAPPGGETTHQLRDRVLAWYAELPPSGVIVAIAHGGPIAALLGSLQNLPVTQWAALIPATGSITEWALLNGGAAVMPTASRNT